MKKKVASLLVGCSILSVSSGICFASSDPVTDTASGKPVNEIKASAVQLSSTYSFVKNYNQTQTEGGWILGYTGHPAAKTGEYDSASFGVSYSNSCTGGLNATLTDVIEASLQYTFGKTESWTATKNSAPLNKGDYVKAYWMKTYDVTNITQIETVHHLGWQGSTPVDYYTQNMNTLYAKHAILPKLRMEYYNKNGMYASSAVAPDKTETSSTTTPYKTETYTWINGQYVKTNE